MKDFQHRHMKQLEGGQRICIAREPYCTINERNFMKRDVRSVAAKSSRKHSTLDSFSDQNNVQLRPTLLHEAPMQTFTHAATSYQKPERLLTCHIEHDPQIGIVVFARMKPSTRLKGRPVHPPHAQNRFRIHASWHSGPCVWPRGQCFRRAKHLVSYARPPENGLSLL
jgi:hypothetical protein